MTELLPFVFINRVDNGAWITSFADIINVLDHTVNKNAQPERWSINQIFLDCA